MNKALLFFWVIVFAGSVFAQPPTTLNVIAVQLFKNVKSKLTAIEKNVIATKIGFVLSGDKDQPFAQDNDSKESPFTASVFPTDINKDGKEEVFIVFGNTYTSGQAGSSVALFIKNTAGVYINNLGFPGMAPDVLVTLNKGYPDLLIGGPGFEYPVWRWNGKEYVYYKSVKDSAYGNLKKTGVEELSNNYQQTLKQ